MVELLATTLRRARGLPSGRPALLCATRHTEEWLGVEVLPASQPLAVSAREAAEAAPLYSADALRRARGALRHPAAGDPGRRRARAVARPITTAVREGAPGGLGRAIHDAPAEWAAPGNRL